MTNIVSTFLTVMLLCIGCTKKPNNSTGPDTSNNPSTTGFKMLYSDPKDSAIGISARNYEGIYVDYNISITFNNQLDINSLNRSLYTIPVAGSNFAIAKIFTDNSYTVKIRTIGYGRQIGSWYRIVIDTSLRDISGNNLIAPETLSFMPEEKLRIIYISATRFGSKFDFPGSNYFRFNTNNAPFSFTFDTVANVFNILLGFNSKISAALLQQSLSSDISQGVVTGFNIDEYVQIGIDTSVIPPIVPGSRHTFQFSTALGDTAGHNIESPINIELNFPDFHGRIKRTGGSYGPDTTTSFLIAYNYYVDSASVASSLKSRSGDSIYINSWDSLDAFMSFKLKKDYNSFDPKEIFAIPIVNIIGQTMSDTAFY
jgi:hypothetical protein